MVPLFKQQLLMFLFITEIYILIISILNYKLKLQDSQHLFINVKVKK